MDKKTGLPTPSEYRLTIETALNEQRIKPEKGYAYLITFASEQHISEWVAKEVKVSLPAHLIKVPLVYLAKEIGITENAALDLCLIGIATGIKSDYSDTVLKYHAFVTEKG